MTEPAAILEREGVLGETLPPVLREALPQILEQHRHLPVHMLVTTMTQMQRRDILSRGSFFRPARQGQPPEFTWKVSGPFQMVLRQFRLDFLRHLGRDAMQCRIRLAIYPMDRHGENHIEEPAPPSDGSRADAAPQPSQFNVQRGEPAQAIRTGPALAATASVAESSAERPHEEAAEVPRSARVIDAYPLEQASTAAAPPASPAHPNRVVTGRGSLSLPGNLYQDYYGFEAMPFNNTPDTHFYFPSPKHQEALSRLIYAISERKGFVMISGEIGAGKSTLCRTLLSQLPQQVRTALISQTHLDPAQLIAAIADDLGIDTAGLSHYEITQALNQYLIDQLAEGATVCIIIDEAQNLPVDALEQVRMISNLETEKEKLVQLILLGQPNLRDKINNPELVQLRQRIAVQYHLEPLEQSETIGYIRHRLRIANPTQKLDFSKGAMKTAYRFSGGVPRLINTLCDNALLTSFIRQKRTITSRMIEEAAKDLALEPKGMAVSDFWKFW